MKKTLLYSLLVILVIFSACSKDVSTDEIPSYVGINTISFTSNYPVEGSSSSKISDGWLYVDDQLVGVFELPFKAPVLKEGPHRISVLAGIKSNGIAAIREAYPFYSLYSQNVTLKRAEQLTIIPTINYVTSNINFKWKEDFENVTASINKSPYGSDTIVNKLTIGNPAIFEGTGCGAIFLDDAHTYFEGLSSSAFTLPKDGTPIFLELNYKCNAPFEVGLYSSVANFSVPALGINASSNWNKIYVKLTGITPKMNAPAYRVYFRFLRNTANSLDEL